jgi:hypothetical protein
VVARGQYRLTQQPGGTPLNFDPPAIGLIPPELQQGVGKGWEDMPGQIRTVAEKMVP